MIEFKKEWAQGMDGGAEFVTERIKRTLPIADAAVSHNSDVGHAIDYAVAVACCAAKEPDDVVRHLKYIAAELARACHNIDREVG